MLCDFQSKNSNIYISFSHSYLWYSLDIKTLLTLWYCVGYLCTSWEIWNMIAGFDCGIFYMFSLFTCSSLLKISFENLFENYIFTSSFICPMLNVGFSTCYIPHKQNSSKNLSRWCCCFLDVLYELFLLTLFSD